MSLTKGNQSQNHVIATKQSPETQTGNEPEPFLSCSNCRPTDLQESETQTLTTRNGNIPALTISTPLSKERLVRDEQTNEMYLTLNSMVGLKRKQELPYVPLDFGNNLTIDVLVDSGAYVSANDQNELDTIKHAPSNVLKFDDPPNFQIQIAFGQLEKPWATTRLWFETGDNTFAESLVVMKKWTGSTIRSHFMRKDSVVIDATHRPIHFPYLTMQVKTASSLTTAKPQLVLTDDSLTLPLRTTKTITDFVEHPSDWDTTCTVTPMEKFAEASRLLSSHSRSIIFDMKLAVGVINTTESPHLIRRNTQVAEFSVVTP